MDTGQMFLKRGCDEMRCDACLQADRLPPLRGQVLVRDVADGELLAGLQRALRDHHAGLLFAEVPDEIRVAAVAEEGDAYSQSAD